MVLVLLIAGGISAYVFLIRPLAHLGEQTAKLMSPDTEIYFTINLRPGADQLLKFRNTLLKFEEESDFEENRDDWIDMLKDETGIDFKDDVLPWLGPEIAVGVIDVFDDAKPLVVIGTTDNDATEGMLEDLIDYLEDSLDQKFERDSYHDFPIYSNEDRYTWEADQHYALINGYILFSTDLEVIEDAISLTESLGASLADDEDFKTAQKSVPSKRVSFLFADIDSMYRHYMETASSGQEEEILAYLRDRTPETVAMSTSFIDNGFRIDFYADNPLGSTFEPGRNEVKSAEIFPSDTLAMISLNNPRSFWDSTMDALGQNEDLLGEFEEALEEFQYEFGLDVERDIFSWMTGELAIALLPSDINLDRYGDVEGTVDVVAVFETDDAEKVDEVLGVIHDILEDEGFYFKRSSMREHDVTLLDGEPFGEFYSPGYTFLPDFLVIGSNKEVLTNIIDTYEGEGSSLREDKGYSQLQPNLEGEQIIQMYFNLEEIREMVLDLLDCSDRATYRREIASFVEPLDSLAITSTITDETSRLTIMIAVK